MTSLIKTGGLNVQVIAKLSFEGKKVLEQTLDVEDGIFEDVIEVKKPKGWTAVLHRWRQVSCDVYQSGTEKELMRGFEAYEIDRQGGGCQVIFNHNGFALAIPLFYEV